MYSPRLILVLLLGLANTCWALPSDREQNIHVAADQVDIDDRIGVSTYVGNVQLTQGSIRLTADSITVYTENRVLVRVIAKGQPASFRQKPETDQEDVVASALQLEYYSLEGRLILSRNATLLQGPNHFTGNRIEYDIQKNYVRAKASKESGERVEVIIQPGTLEK